MAATTSLRSSARRLAAGTSLAVAFGLSFSGIAAADDDPPGDRGTVKIHNADTPDEDPGNEPHVCEFIVVGHGFHGGQNVEWVIKSWPPTGDRSDVLSGTLETDDDGNASTGEQGLDDGHYRLEWNVEGQQGQAGKHKMFWVDCDGNGNGNGNGNGDGDGDGNGDGDEDDAENGEDDENGDVDDAEAEDADAEAGADDAEAEDADGDDAAEVTLPRTGPASTLAALGLSSLFGGAVAMLWSRRRTAADQTVGGAG